MKDSDADSSTGTTDPDADPEMKTSGTHQPDQAEGDDDATTTGDQPK